MTSIYWDSQRVTIIDYFEQGRTINGAYYAGKFRREIARKREGKLMWCSALALNIGQPTKQKQ